MTTEQQIVYFIYNNALYVGGKNKSVERRGVLVWDVESPCLIQQAPAEKGSGQVAVNLIAVCPIFIATGPVVVEYPAHEILAVDAVPNELISTRWKQLAGHIQAPTPRLNSAAAAAIPAPPKRALPESMPIHNIFDKPNV